MSAEPMAIEASCHTARWQMVYGGAKVRHASSLMRDTILHPGSDIYDLNSCQ